MLISELHVTNYRCFEKIHIQNLGKIVCIVGANGSGKSSILNLIAQILGGSSGRSIFIRDEWNGDTTKKTLSISVSLTDDECQSLNLPQNLLTSTIPRDLRLFPLAHYSETGNPRYHEGIANHIINKISKEHLVLYGPSRSFIFQDYGDPRIDRQEPEIYTRINLSNFDNRARLLSSLMTRLLNDQRADLSRKVQQEREKFDGGSYEELPEVREVFQKFFSITGKKFMPPEIRDDGRVSYFFKIPWSPDPIPLSALSSGEQWLLLFFLELRINKWNNHIILIDEIEQHLHPQLAIKFVKELKESSDSNQYWITTHLPTIARYLRDSTIGLVLTDKKVSEQIDPTSLELLRDLTGQEGIIPIGKTIVLLEGSKAKNRSVSVDQAFFEEMKRIKLIPDYIELVSTGHVGSLMDMSRTLPDFERQIGLGWKIYSIRDRDAMTDAKRHEIMKSQGGRMWIWERSSIEGYLLEPELVHGYLKSSAIDPLPSIDEIEKVMIDYIISNKNEILRRFENQLVYLDFPKRGSASLNWLTEADSVARSLQPVVIEFENEVKKRCKNGDWRYLLSYVNCKSLMEHLYGKLAQTGFSKSERVVELIQRIVRDVIHPKLNAASDKSKELDSIFYDFAVVLRSLNEGQDFTI